MAKTGNLYIAFGMVQIFRLGLGFGSGLELGLIFCTLQITCSTGLEGDGLGLGHRLGFELGTG